jgi:Domain of unknown function (DUF4386)
VARLARSSERRAVDWVTRAGAVAFVIAAAMTLPALFSVHPPTDPAHNREFALGANSFSYRLTIALQVYALPAVILGTFALYRALSGTRARRWVMAGLVVIVVGACFVLPGSGFASLVMPAAGIMISQGHDQDVLHLLDLVFQEPAWIPVFLGGIAYEVGLVILSIGVWRSGILPRWVAVLLAVAGVLGLPAFLDVTLAQAVEPAVAAAAFLATAVGLWQLATHETRSERPQMEVGGGSGRPH